MKFDKKNDCVSLASANDCLKQSSELHFLEKINKNNK